MVKNSNEYELLTQLLGSKARASLLLYLTIYKDLELPLTVIAEDTKIKKSQVSIQCQLLTKLKILERRDESTNLRRTLYKVNKKNKLAKDLLKFISHFIEDSK